MTSPADVPCAVIEPGHLTLTQAIFFSDHPGALRRDYPAGEDQSRVLRKMDRLFASAEQEQPLEWQACRARLRKQDVIGTTDAAARIVAMRRVGASPPPLGEFARHPARFAGTARPAD